MRIMRNAGYQVADFIRQEPDPGTVHVYAGTGNNGGDGLVAVRRLHLWGYDVSVVLASRDLDGIRAEELDILEMLDVPVGRRVGRTRTSSSTRSSATAWTAIPVPRSTG
ncbi:MAG: NAD(P)H-hydrate epimerase [Candidatus Nanohaloarchaea archaeon]|nr:NAD(P)H-hydrate epimerase [Candidatus Nanohaloarchaea archaeon]